MGDKIYVPYQEAESEFVEKRSHAGNPDRP